MQFLINNKYFIIDERIDERAAWNVHPSIEFVSNKMSYWSILDRFFTNFAKTIER